MDLSKLVASAIAVALCFAATQTKIPHSSKLIPTEVKSVNYPPQDLVAKNEDSSKAEIELILYVPAIDIRYFNKHTVRDQLVPIYLYLPEQKIEVLGKLTDIIQQEANSKRKFNYPVYLALVQAEISKSEAKKLLDFNLINSRITHNPDRTFMDLLVHFYRYHFDLCYAKADCFPQLSKN